TRPHEREPRRRAATPPPRPEAKAFSWPPFRRRRLDADLIFAAHLRVGVVAGAPAALVLPFAHDLVAHRREWRRHRRRAIRNAHVMRSEARVDRPGPFADRHVFEGGSKGGT